MNDYYYLLFIIIQLNAHRLVSCEIMIQQKITFQFAHHFANSKEKKKKNQQKKNRFINQIYIYFVA